MSVINVGFNILLTSATCLFIIMYVSAAESKVIILDKMYCMTVQFALSDMVCWLLTISVLQP